VLVVEDDPDAREVLQLVFESEGYGVTAVSNGQEALDELRTHPLPDVVVTDLMMPAVTGWDLCAAIQATPELASVAIVVVSAVAPCDALSPLYADAVLPKPVDLEALLATVGRLCRQAFPRSVAG
jgi:CheY-like chemotaxis protein